MIENCRYHTSENKCSIDGNPCFKVSGFEDWECSDYQDKELEELE